MHVSAWQMKQQAEECANRVQYRNEMSCLQLPAAGAGQCVHNIEARQNKAETVQ